MPDAWALARTSLGDLQGMREGGVCAWLGVPYAEPPAGARRFLAAEPVQPWPGMRSATAFGAACPQKVMGSLKALGPRLDEDCLTLNIWSPAPDGRRRPVMVWLHGGAFLVGSARLYTGAHLAAQGDVVVVAVNYRLGVLGFMNFGEALGDARVDSNLGLRDQVLALRWVQEHIAAFGGDPAQVTLAGESAGSLSVSLLMHAPEARPLFHRAILQSGALSLVHDREASLQVARVCLGELGVGTLEALQAVPLPALLAAQAAVHRKMPHTIPAAPWFDGALLPPSLADARESPTPAIPLLAGYNRDEIRLFELLRGVADVFLSRELMQEVLQRQLGPQRAAQVMAAYPESTEGRRRLGTHMSFAMPTLHFAERHAAAGHPAWFYRFDLGHPMLGALHGIELLYLWDVPGPLPLMLRGGPLWGSRGALAQRLRAHWLRFVREGRPGDAWAPFDGERRATMVFDRRDRMVDDPEGRQRAAWAGQDSAAGMVSIGS